MDGVILYISSMRRFLTAFSFFLCSQVHHVGRLDARAKDRMDGIIGVPVFFLSFFISRTRVIYFGCVFSFSSRYIGSGMCVHWAGRHLKDFVRGMCIFMFFSSFFSGTL